jgi:hypothetical protein
MVQPKYNVILKLPTGEKYDFEKFSGLRWEDYENQPGRCTFSVPQDDPKLANLQDTNKFIQIIVLRDSVLVWQGFVAFISDDLDKTTFYGLSLLECLKWYRSGYNTVYTTKKLGSEIISPIWDAIDGRSGAILGDIVKKGTIEDPYTTGTTDAKTITRTTFDEDFFTLCTQMIYLARADSPSGAWVQNTVMAVSLSETDPTFSFLRNVGEDKPQVIFELDSEIVDYLYTQDYRLIRNDVKGLAIVAGPEVINNTQTDATSQSLHYLREISMVFSNLSSASELEQRTKDFLKDSKLVESSWYLSFTSSIAPYAGYSMGDNIMVRINRGRVNLSTYFRVIGMEVTVSDQGSEICHPILEQKRT